MAIKYFAAMPMDRYFWYLRRLVFELVIAIIFMWAGIMLASSQWKALGLFVIAFAMLLVRVSLAEWDGRRER